MKQGEQDEAHETGQGRDISRSELIRRAERLCESWRERCGANPDASVECQTALTLTEALLRALSSPGEDVRTWRGRIAELEAANASLRERLNAALDLLQAGP